MQTRFDVHCYNMDENLDMMKMSRGFPNSRGNALLAKGPWKPNARTRQQRELVFFIHQSFFSPVVGLFVPRVCSPAHLIVQVIRHDGRFQELVGRSKGQT